MKNWVFRMTAIVGWSPLVLRLAHTCGARMARTDPRFHAIDRIIAESASAYLQTNAGRADNLCRDAQFIVGIIEGDMTAGELSVYVGMKR